ncbi:hypothetical protein ACRTD6_02380 [Vibrio parahaemolyticus]|nr:hypothetical protein [Vibrio parahaemolyticus]MCI9698164.1 hypothetical protein [Vibrio parahaemolyticus]MCR9644035.1 hypothetical protein [Vibrio parahaemolyticus]MCR9798775.1 hypothetical protein [Vibrio parahaemolyticus]MDF4313740.1 hypothetical protein [Vibrio parahaemolyticus]MDF4597468.1 hypothetical protein [Vibrio parahaemolyticus]
MLATEKKQAQKKQVFDRKRLQKALASGKDVAPQGMSREEKRLFLSGK